MENESLLKILVQAGLGSRRKIAGLIREGSVAVNGQTVTDFRYPITRDQDRITIDGKRVEVKQEPPVYLVLNKPPGTLSTVRDERGRRTVIDILPAKKPWGKTESGGAAGHGPHRIGRKPRVFRSALPLRTHDP